jgi:integrase
MAKASDRSTKRKAKMLLKKLQRKATQRFRHTYSRCCAPNGEDPKVVQELLRHSSIKVTMDVYTQAVTATKR